MVPRDTIVSAYEPILEKNLFGDTNKIKVKKTINKT